MRMVFTHPRIDICMKKDKKNTIKSISLSAVKKCVFCIDHGSFVLFFFGEISVPVTYVGASSKAEDVNTYFRCVSLFYEVTFAEIRASVMLFRRCCFHMIILSLK